MVDLVKLFSSEGKGSKSTYRPGAGTRCMLSGPNCDQDDRYVYFETTILWSNDTFVLYGTEGCWPVLNKWDHVRAKPLPESPSLETAVAPPCIKIGDRVRVTLSIHSEVPTDGWTVYKLPTQEWRNYGLKHENGGDMSINAEYVLPL